MLAVNPAEEEILILALESYVEKFKNQIRGMENTAGQTCGDLRELQSNAEALLAKLSPESFGNAVNVELMDGRKIIIHANKRPL